MNRHKAIIPKKSWESQRLAGNRRPSVSVGNLHRSISLTLPHMPFFLSRIFPTPRSRNCLSLPIAAFITCFVIPGPFFKGPTKTVPFLKLKSPSRNFKISVIRQHKMCVRSSATYTHVGPVLRTWRTHSSQRGPAKGLALPNLNWGGRLFGGLPVFRAMSALRDLRLIMAATGNAYFLWFSAIKISPGSWVSHGSPPTAWLGGLPVKNLCFENVSLKARNKTQHKIRHQTWPFTLRKTTSKHGKTKTPSPLVGENHDQRSFTFQKNHLKNHEHIHHLLKTWQKTILHDTSTFKPNHLTTWKLEWYALPPSCVQTSVRNQTLTMPQTFAKLSNFISAI